METDPCKCGDFSEVVVFISARSINFLMFQEIALSEKIKCSRARPLSSPTEQHTVKYMEEIVSQLSTSFTEAERRYQRINCWHTENSVNFSL